MFECLKCFLKLLPGGEFSEMLPDIRQMTQSWIPYLLFSCAISVTQEATGTHSSQVLCLSCPSLSTRLLLPPSSALCSGSSVPPSSFYSTNSYLSVNRQHGSYLSSEPHNHKSLITRLLLYEQKSGEDAYYSDDRESVSCLSGSVLTKYPATNKCLGWSLSFHGINLILPRRVHILEPAIAL